MFAGLVTGVRSMWVFVLIGTAEQIRVFWTLSFYCRARKMAMKIATGVDEIVQLHRL